MKKLQALLIVGLVFTLAAAAAPITTLVNTGNGTPGTTDASWDVFSADAYVTNDAGNTAFPFKFDGNQIWAANTTTSKWISPQGSYDPAGTVTDLPGNAGYDYYLRFDLGGYDHTTAQFNFQYMADNQLMFVQLNGVTVFTGANYGVNTNYGAELGSWNAGTLVSSGFVAGVNTLYFAVYNAPGAIANPSGLRVEFTSSDANVVIPEPATFALVGLALLGLPLLRRRR